MVDHLAACSNGAGEWGAGGGLTGAYHPTQPAIQTPNANAYVRIGRLSVRSDSTPFVLRAAGMERDASSLVIASPNGQVTAVMSAGTS